MDAQADVPDVQWLALRAQVKPRIDRRKVASSGELSCPRLPPLLSRLCALDAHLVLPVCTQSQLKCVELMARLGPAQGSEANALVVPAPKALNP